MALLHITLLFCICFVSPIFAEQETCSFKEDVISELKTRYNLSISNVHLNIHYDIQKTNVNPMENGTMEVFLSDSNATFLGHIVPSSQKEKKIHSTFNLKTFSLLRKWEVSKGAPGINCEINYMGDVDAIESLEDSKKLPKKVQKVIIQLVQNCVKTFVCKKFSAIVSNNFISEEKYSRNSENYKTRQTYENCSKELEKIYNPQKTIDVVADFTLKLFVKLFTVDHNGTINIPKFSQKHVNDGIFTFLLPNSEFTAYSGTFKDLKSLKRMNNIILKKDKERFSASTTVRFNRIDILLDPYIASYGVFTTAGKLEIIIHGMTFDITIAMNFNSKPCKVELAKFEHQKSQQGEVEIDFTGLGVLNSPVSYVIKKIMQRKAFEIMKSHVESQITKLKCEHLRPLP